MRVVISVALMGIFLLFSDVARPASNKGPETPLDQIKKRSIAKSVGVPRPKKIILGSDAAPGLFPYQVSLIFSGANKGEEFADHFCGGSLIGDDWVLTAGHCVTLNDEIAPANVIHVYVGSNNFRNGDRIPVKSVFRHPSYSTELGFDNDIALLKLERAPKAGTRYSRIALIEPGQEPDIVPGTVVTIVGWGNTEEGAPSRNLRYATVKVTDRVECNENIVQKRAEELDASLSTIARRFRVPQTKLKNIREAIVANAGAVVTEAMICAGEPTVRPSVEQVRDTCQGDSGGPLIVNVAERKPLQIGVVSWGEGCGTPKLHGVYTRLTTFVGWVKSVMAE